MAPNRILSTLVGALLHAALVSVLIGDEEGRRQTILPGDPGHIRIGELFGLRCLIDSEFRWSERWRGLRKFQAPQDRRRLSPRRLRPGMQLDCVLISIDGKR
jgi:hypothetical protein